MAGLMGTRALILPASSREMDKPCKETDEIPVDMKIGESGNIICSQLAWIYARLLGHSKLLKEPFGARPWKC
jgi:hypothetical protein